MLVLALQNPYNYDNLVAYFTLEMQMRFTSLGSLPDRDSLQTKQ